MKKTKTTKPFYFEGMSHSEMVEILNTYFPISLKHNEDLINRIADRYPLLNKVQISQIVKLVFKSMRELLIMGKILNFNSLFFDTKLFFFKHRKNGVIYPALKVKISTPPHLRTNREI